MMQSLNEIEYHDEGFFNINKDPKKFGLLQKINELNHNKSRYKEEFK